MQYRLFFQNQEILIYLLWKVESMHEIIITNSPLCFSPSKYFSASDNVPRKTSSYIFVSSLPIFACLSPQNFLSCESVFNMRWGDSKIMTGYLLPAIFLKNVSLPFLCGGKPKNVNSERLMSLKEMIAAREDGPGIVTISAKVAASFISLCPGSDIPGVPASVTNARFLPSSSNPVIRSSTFGEECS